MSLFKLGNFTLHGGSYSDWKIDCDALTWEDWETLAFLAAKRLPPFGYVEGVPSGGTLFAKALEKHITRGPLLIVDDVLTTGSSLESFRGLRTAVGCVVFDRGRGTLPGWCISLFTVNQGAL